MKKKSDKRFGSKSVTYEHLDKIGEVAVYYGFLPTKSPTITKEDIRLAKDILDGDSVDDETSKHGRLPLHVEEKIAIIRDYQEKNMQDLPQPVMLYFKDSFRGSIKNNQYHRYADMEILGSSGTIADATLIQTARVMLAEEGYKDISIEINSVGDRDSIARFVKELTGYYRKNINEMNAEARQIFKRDPFELLSWHDESIESINSKAPKSMDFLSENSRRHLEEVLEYLESLDIPYTINDRLVGNRKYCTETIFTIINNAIEKRGRDSHQRILAVGVRYNGLAKRLGMKKDLQGVGISLVIKNNKESLRKSISKVKKPIASFIQLGIESKLASLSIIESLRRVKIPLCISLNKDRLGAQVSSIERFHTPYILVMGKKEAVDKTVIVRRNDTHAQNTVSFEELPKFMKKIDDNI